MPEVVICNVITENALCIGTIFENLFVMDTRYIYCSFSWNELFMADPSSCCIQKKKQYHSKKLK